MTTNVFEAVYAAFSRDESVAIERVRSGNSKLCHYTSADNGLNIIRSQAFWLRNTRCMNDYSEIAHGKQLIIRTLTGDDRRIISSFEEILNACSPGIFAQFVETYGRWMDTNSDIFIGCLSEHDPQDSQGRLSMWRAYGSNSGGVCFVFNSTPFMSETDQLGVISVPVSYYNDVNFKDILDGIQTDLRRIIEDLRNVPPERIVEVLTMLFVFKTISLKHPGFSEEREWRIVLLPDWRKGAAIVQDVVSVAGLPQTVYKIPLKNEPQQGLIGADIPNLLSKVIIGPSDQPYVVWDAYVNLLTELGVEDAHDKVVISGIPLRIAR